MSPVGVNSEPLQDRLIFAYDGSNYRVVACDASGHLLAALATGQAVQADAYGWYASAWHKSPLPFGYSSQYLELLVNTDLPITDTTMNGTAVPAGKICVVTQAFMMYVGTPPTRVTINLTGATTSGLVLSQPSPVSRQGYCFAGHLILVAGNYMTGYVTGATLHDDVYFSFNGYYVDLVT